jgi:hypothetical protein
LQSRIAGIIIKTGLVEYITISIDVTEEEFAKKCAEILRGGKYLTGGCIINTVDFCFENAVSKIPFINKFKIQDRWESGKFKGDNHDIDYYIDLYGGFSISWYKFEIGSKKLIDIKCFEFPPYMELDINSRGLPDININKKSLKTRSHIIIDIAGIKISKEVLGKTRKLLPEGFFLTTHNLGGKKQYAKENVMAFEKLPYPVVIYPHLGAFIGFKKHIANCEIHFCSCMKNAIENCIKMSVQENEIKILLNSLPEEIHGRLDINNISDDTIKAFNFDNSICHECNHAVPSYYYPIPRSVFYKSYGWYVEKQFFEYGIDRSHQFGRDFHAKLILENKCPEHIIKLFDLDLSIAKNNKMIMDDVEDDVRVNFDYHKKGEEWVNETNLYYEIKQEFSEYEVIHHGKPEWIKSQHLDIWIPQIKAAVEYQGIQHLKPVKYMGGEEGLSKTRERDERKARLCKENNVTLVLVYEGYVLSDVIAKIKESVNFTKL